jgi:hypothetical protein
MRKFTPNFLAMLFTALFIGLGLSYFSLADGRFIGTYHIGSWATWANVGTPKPDPYTKAFVSLRSTLQLGRSEGVQFIAQRDNNGELLQITCNYSIAGETPDANFWTLSASAPDGHSITPIGANQTMHSKRVSRNNNGMPTIHVGKQLSSGNWLEITGEGYFELILTLYDASVLSGFGGTLSTLPIIKNEGCS